MSRKDENSSSVRYTHLSVHSALFIVTKTWKQPMCPQTDEWIKWGMYTYWYMFVYIYVYTHTGILLSHKKEWNNAIYSNRNWEIIILIKPELNTELSQTEKDKYHVIPLICGILKNDTSELIYKIDNKLTDIENWTYGYQRGNGGKGGIHLGSAIKHTLYLYKVCK